MGRNEDEMAMIVCSSSKTGRIEDEVVAIDKRNRLPRGEPVGFISSPGQNLALTL